MTHYEKVRQYVVALEPEQSFTTEDIMIKTGLSDKNQIRPYLTRLKREGIADNVNPVLRNGIWKRTNNGLTTQNCMPPIETCESDHMEVISDFQKQIAALDWVLTEYIPELEAEKAKAEQHATDLYRQMNSLFGVLKKARTIQERHEAEENDKEAVIHLGVVS